MAVENYFGQWTDGQFTGSIMEDGQWRNVTGISFDPQQVAPSGTGLVDSSATGGSSTIDVNSPIGQLITGGTPSPSGGYAYNAQTGELTDPATGKPIVAGGTTKQQTGTDIATQANLLFPWIPAELRQVFINAWTQYGDPNLAMAAMRQDPRYEQYFPGNRRPDGTLRMDEQTYFSTVEGYNRRRSAYGLSTLSADQQLKLITGDVSPDEFGNRLDNAYLHLVSNIDNVRQYYAQNYGAGNLSDSALFESYMDPTVSPLEAQRRLTAAEIGGEASMKGINIARTEAERLGSFGLDQQQSRTLFSQVAQQMPTLSELQQRFNDPNDPLTAEHYAEALVLNDPSELAHVARLFGQARSQYSASNLFTPNQMGGAAGLYAR